MNSREILLYFSLKYSGDWNLIFKAISEHEEYDKNEAKELIKTVTSPYITYSDDDYPEYLKRAVKPPFVLYYYGDISLLSDARNRLAVVGSRKCSEYGALVTQKFVKELCKDFVIVSGLAYGVDAIAHQTAIDNGGKTIAVLGNGIDFCYLKQNEEIYEECKRHHLVVSEYPKDVLPYSYHFPIRNRIIVALSETLLVTEGKIRSGTQITAMLMAGKNGSVCCVPTRIGEESICNYLISEGAFLAETPDDVYEVAHVVKKKPVFEN